MSHSRDFPYHPTLKTKGNLYKVGEILFWTVFTESVIPIRRLLSILLEKCVWMSLAETKTVWKQCAPKKNLTIMLHFSQSLIPIFSDISSNISKMAGKPKARGSLAGHECSRWWSVYLNRSPMPKCLWDYTPERPRTSAFLFQSGYTTGHHSQGWRMQCQDIARDNDPLSLSLSHLFFRKLELGIF